MKNQSNNFNEEDCVHALGVKYNYEWNDVNCSDCHQYTCQKGRHSVFSVLFGVFSCNCFQSQILFMFDGKNVSKVLAKNSSKKSILTCMVHLWYIKTAYTSSLTMSHEKGVRLTL